MGSTPPPKRLAIPPSGLAAQPSPGATPEAFAALTKKAMMAELKRLGIARGKSKARKAELVAFYRAHCEAPAELPPAEEHFPTTITLSPTIVIKTLPPPEQRELESLAAEEHFPATTTLSPEVSYKTLPPAERREVEDAVEEDRRINPRAEIAVNIGEASETNFFVGQSRDITAGGIFVAIPQLGESDEQSGGVILELRITDSLETS